MPNNSKIIGKTVGAAITVYNEREYLRRCLNSGRNQWSFAVVVDNGSTDGTSEMLGKDFPDVIRIKGNEELWWTGGTNLAVKRCIEEGCDYVLLVNADLILESGCVENLMKIADKNEKTISASLVLNIDKPDEVWWAGGNWGPVAPGIPIYLCRPVVKRGTKIKSISKTPFKTSDFHGRGVLLPAEVFKVCGLFDEENFPHYSADTDFALRAKKAGFDAMIVPEAITYLSPERTKILVKKNDSLKKRWHFFLYLVRDERNRGGFRTMWKFFRRHTPYYALIPTYLLMFLNAILYIFKPQFR